MQAHLISPETLVAMRVSAERLSYRPLINIVVSIAPHSVDLVEELISSIQQQVYTHWDLRIACDPTCCANLESVVNARVRADGRIRIVTAELEADVWRFSGEYVVIISPEGELAPEALFSIVETVNENCNVDIVYADEDVIDGEGEKFAPYFKPGWSPDLLLATNYVGPLLAVRKDLLVEIPDYSTILHRSELHSLALRLGEKAKCVVRVPRVLCHVRMPMRDVRGEDTAIACKDDDNVKAIHEALVRRGETAEVNCIGPGQFKLIFQMVGNPFVSIIIPTRDKGDLLQQCLDSIRDKTSGMRYEVLVLDNGSTDLSTLNYLRKLPQTCRVIHCPGPFNYSALNNRGVSQARGEYVLFLNNDVEVQTCGWLAVLVAHAQRRGVGAVGAKLVYRDGSVQHAGVVVGVAGVAGHAFRHTPVGLRSYHGFVDLMRNCSAVTAACMLVPKDIFLEVGGFDEQLRVEYNDVDLCLRIQRRGYRIVYTPGAVLFHYENATRKGGRSLEDEARFKLLWDEMIKKGDPYYNPNLTRVREDWSLNV